MMPNVCGIIFDLGGVVIDWNPRHLYEKVFAGEPNKIEQFLTEVCPLEWNELQDAGRALATATRQRVAKFPDWKDAIEAYYGRWKEMVGGAIPGTSELLADLKRSRVRLFALSNWSAETFPLVRDEYSELALFEQTFLSCQYGLTKPNPRLYEIVLSLIDIPRDQLLFVDDNSRNVQAAEKIGLPAILFENARQLRRHLISRGISVDPTH